MANWPKQPRLLSTELPRIDGLPKASGKAKYPSDMRPEGLLFGAVLYSPHGSARIKSIDISAAEKSPGVKAVEVLNGEGKTLRFHGDDIAVVVAETEEQARDGVRAIKVEYEVLPSLATEQQALARRDTPEGRRAVRPGREAIEGDPDSALQNAAATITGEYSVPVITHCCLEPHGLTAKWEADDKLTVWASTQSVMGVADQLAQNLQIPVTNVTVLTDYMGAGFGSKFGPDIWGVTAARLAKKTGRPVKIFLDREQEQTSGGNRPSAMGKLTLGCDKQGKLTAIVAETYGTGGRLPIPYVYDVPNSRINHTQIGLNIGGSRAWRAPNHPQACALTELAVDDLAEKLGIDPLEMRLKSLKEDDPVGGGLNRSDIYRDQIRIGAERFGWEKLYKKRGTRQGIVRTGVGMALHQWGGGGAQDKKVSVTINPDGSVEVRSATQDIGTGIRTLLAMITAEVLGLQVADIRSNIGNSTFPPGQSSGGSTTTPSMAPPCLVAASQARDEFLKRIAPGLNASPDQLELKDGHVVVQGERQVPWKEACRKLGMMPVAVTGGFEQGLSSVGVGGCQFAEVSVDTETGVVRIHRIVAVQDSGLILNMLTWKSQVYGGVIMGLNGALFEEQITDPSTGAMLNPDMEMYKLAGISDIPEIIIEPYHTEQMRARGVIGVGEPPVISTMAAVANAVANAIGVRVPRFPMTPMNVLNALASAPSA